MTKEYLQDTKKPRSQKIENCIRRVKTVNNYIPLMKQRAQKLTKRELIKTVILKTIPNKWLQDLKRANNHNLAILEELQSVLKPIEEADESDQQENSRQKQKPRFERPSNGSTSRGKGNNPCKKDGHKHDWKDCPDNKYGNNFHESHQQDIQRDSSQERTICFEEHETNMIDNKDWYMNNEDDLKDLPELMTPDYSNSEGEESDEECEDTDDESVTETHLLQVKSKKEKLVKKKTVAKATVQFSLEDSKGNRNTYLDLLGTGSTASLISEELVKKYKLATINNKSTWETNNGAFKTGKTTVADNLRFPQFTNKRKVTESKFYVNKNIQQKYKIIFGLDFLIENKIDFLLSAGIIDWQGIQIAIDGHHVKEVNKEECQTNGKSMKDNTYQKHTGPSVASHTNAKHISEKEKEALGSLMSDFEGLLKGTVGDYKEMEISFEVNHNKTPYHAKPYRISVAHTQMMKTAIK